jgi:predicted nucleic acid-binding protein
VILADTSIWIDHLNQEDAEMRRRLDSREIVMHPYIVAELALGSLRDRLKKLTELDRLPRIKAARIDEVRQLIEARKLYSRGIGLTDAHLIAAVLINPSTQLWTRDKALRSIAESLSIHVAWK